MTKSASRTILASCALLLAACSTPLEQCMSDARSELSAMLDLRAETSSNVDRGYAIHRQQVPYQYTGVCYNQDVGNYSCPLTGYRTQETPVSIDVRFERKRLKDIDRRLPQLERQAEAAVSQCRATYPDETT